MLADNQPLVCVGPQLSKLKLINQQPSLLAADIFYSMAQAVMPKASSEAISLGGGLMLGGLLASIGINDSKIIPGVPNIIPSPSRLWYMVKISPEAKFMRIAGVF